MKKLVILTSLLALALITFYILDRNPPKKIENDSSAKEQSDKEEIVKLTDDQIKTMGLHIQTATPGNMVLSLTARGKITLDPDHLAHVIPKIAGIAQEARKNMGNYVRQGEIIAVLESQAIADLKAAYLSALSKEKLTFSNLVREEKLYQKRISAGQDFFNAQNAYEEAHIQAQLAMHKLHALGLTDEEISRLADPHDFNLRSYNIYAPIDGVVTMRHMTQGEYIENTATIYEIADLSHVWVEMSIYPKDLHRIHEGQWVEVLNPDNQTSAQAKLIYISPIIANETIAAKAIALLDNPYGKWRPGSFVKVNIATDQIACSMIISKEAIQKMDGKDYAFVATPKGFEKRALQLGHSDAQYVEVLAGLTPDEQYVSRPSFLLKAELNKDSAKDDD